MFKRLLTTSAVDVYALVVGMISLAVTARLLGAEGRGLFVVGTSLAALFGSLMGLSVERVLIFRAAGSKSIDWPRIFAELLLFWIFAAVCVPLILLPLYWLGKSYLFPSVTAAIFLVVLLLSILIIWHQLQLALLLVSDRIAVFNRSKLAGATATAALVILFVWPLNGGALGAIWGVLLGRLVEVAWGLAGTRDFLALPRRTDLDGLFGLVAQGLKLHINTVANVLRTNADVLMLNAFLGPAASGLFQLSSRLIDFMMIIPSAASRLFQGQIVSLGPAGYWPAQKRLMARVFVLLLAGSMFAYILAPGLVPLVFGVEFSVSALYFQWLLPIAFGKAYGVMMATQAIARGYLWLSSAVGISAAILNIVLNLLLIPRFQIEGAVVATVISFGLVPFVVNTCFFLHYERENR